MTIFETRAGASARHDELGRIGRPVHDVDLLAAQLLHHALHARALHADAGADRIDVAIVASTTAILARPPGSRAAPLTSTMPS